LKDGIYLVPVRAFIGIGWLRACAEKIIEPGWRDGASLAAFLDHQMQSGMVVFPAYRALVGDVFLAQALVLGWIVMIGQLLAGAAILTGSLTRAALLGGIFMNLNFLLAGVPDPSAFYIVIQVVLLMAGAGAVLGIDALLAAHGRFPLLAARPPGLQPSLALPAPAGIALAILACGIAVYATAQIRDWSPAGSVRDPAAVLAVLAYKTASWATIAALRGDRNPPAAQSRLARPRA
jgi:thiosulfate dehydrogenase [quinone] large subunit